MHRRQLVILYSVLCVIAALLSWRLVTQWKQAHLRYAASYNLRVERGARISPSSPSHPALPVVDVAGIVAKNLFNADRNSEVAKEEKPQPPPPVPVVIGTMNLGGAYEALMADKGPGAKPGFHRIKKGEQIGGYTVVDISDEKVQIEFQGQKSTIEVYQSSRSVPRQESPRSLPAAPPVVVSGSNPSPPPQSAGTAQQPSSTDAANTGTPVGNDPLLRMTIEGNRRKFERQTMFGPQVWYEDIPK